MPERPGLATVAAAGAQSASGEDPARRRHASAVLPTGPFPLRLSAGDSYRSQFPTSNFQRPKEVVRAIYMRGDGSSSGGVSPCRANQPIALEVGTWELAVGS